ncbi:hypothetical protein AVEN_96447-1, partial [Araneus ventricosus]
DESDSSTVISPKEADDKSLSSNVPKGLKPGCLERKRHELNSPNLGGHLPHYTTLCYNLPLRKWAAVCKDNWTLLLRLSPKPSQNLNSLQNKPTASNRPSSVLEGNF